MAKEANGSLFDWPKFARVGKGERIKFRVKVAGTGAF